MSFSRRSLHIVNIYGRDKNSCAIMDKTGYFAHFTVLPYRFSHFVKREKLFWSTVC